MYRCGSNRLLHCSHTSHSEWNVRCDNFPCMLSVRLCKWCAHWSFSVAMWHSTLGSGSDWRSQSEQNMRFTAETTKTRQRCTRLSLSPPTTTLSGKSHRNHDQGGTRMLLRCSTSAALCLLVGRSHVVNHALLRRTTNALRIASS